MSIQSKSARILAVVSGLVLASACGEGAESAEPQEASAQVAPDSLTEQEAAFNYSNCPQCISDFWAVASNGMAVGWACRTDFPTTSFEVVIYKANGSWREIGRGWATGYNPGLSSVCGGTANHQFDIYVGPWNAGPGQYMMIASAGFASTIDYVTNY